MTLLFILVTAAILYINQVLDYATTRASRQIMTGSTQSQATPATLSSFTQSLCSYLPAVISCSNVVVNLYVVPKAVQPSGYYGYVKSDMSGLVVPALTPGSGQFNLGTRGDYQYLQVIYPITFLPSAFAPMLSGGLTYNGKAAYLAISTVAFRNEQYQ
ncbi:hypothetical protein MPOCJGCO_0501 [Methylobacterium trifolii]|uniref:Pilus assembly protein n=2 Tax=Methylobacterium trifolii TaxID=1003092 RepID=A0ABQ4TT99_9HYPH|nr:hypothetical protein MPOCJGCO_0501 [Methylobacterium trifolii]